MVNNTKMSTTLITLLHYSKTCEEDVTWKTVADVLAPLYYPDMSLRDAFAVLIKAFEEASAIPKLEISKTTTSLHAIVMSPVNGFTAIDWPAPTNGINTTYSIEQFYNAMFKHMVSALRFTKIDWCRDIIFTHVGEK